MRVAIALLGSLQAAAGAPAHSVPAALDPACDRWGAPMPPAKAGDRTGVALAPSKAAPPFHFKFKGRRGYAPPANAAPQHSGNAAVAAMGAMDRNGFLAVNCPQTPMDPACH